MRKLDRAQRVKQMHAGRIEALLARHWPAAGACVEAGGATLARAVLAKRKTIARCRRELRRLTADHPQIQAQAQAVGLVTACVLWMGQGDPRDYGSAAAYRKAMGLDAVFLVKSPMQPIRRPGQPGGHVQSNRLELPRSLHPQPSDASTRPSQTHLDESQTWQESPSRRTSRRRELGRVNRSEGSCME